MSASHNQSLIRRYFAGIDADYYAEDAELHDMSQERPLRGRAAIREFLRMYLGEAFPEGEYQLHRVFADETGAAAEWTFRGTNSGPLLGVEPTHRAVEFSGVSLYDIADGLFTRVRVYYDTGALADQLGLVGHRLPRSVRFGPGSA